MVTEQKVYHRKPNYPIEFSAVTGHSPRRYRAVCLKLDLSYSMEVAFCYYISLREQEPRFPAYLAKMTYKASRIIGCKPK